MLVSSRGGNVKFLANDVFSTGIKAKIENKGQYNQYLDELKALREELGVPLKEDLYPEAK